MLFASSHRAVAFLPMPHISPVHPKLFDLHCRPCNKEELYTRAPQVITCNEAAREATLYQTLGGKSLGRSFHFDKVRLPLLLMPLVDCVW